MGVLLEDQESESRRLGPWLELPPSPPRSVWAAVVAAWVSCWRRCRRLAQAGCSCGAVEGVSPPDAGPPDAAAVPPPAEVVPSWRKAAAARSFIERAPSRSEERRVGEEGRSRWSPYH